MRSSVGLLAVLLLGEAALALGLEGPASPAGPLAALALLLGPGLAVAHARGRASAEDWVVLGAASFGLTTLGLAFLVPLIGFSAGRLVPLLLAASALGWWAGRRGAAERPTPPAHWPVWLLAGLAALVVLPPFLRIGRLTPDGHAFRTFFDHDFLVHLSVIGELGKGQFPPENPYFGGTPLHYYWLYFLFPALARKLGGEACSGPNSLVLCNYATAVLFAACLAVYLLHHGARPLRAALLGALLLLCGSFEGLLVLSRIGLGLLPAHPGDYNVDAATRWFVAPPQIDALLRGLLYTHQHLAALSGLLALGLTLQRRAGRGVGWTVFALLLPLPGLSGFVGAIAWAWVLCLGLLDATGDPERQWRGVLLGALAGVAGGLLAGMVLGMFGGTTGFVQIQARPRTWQNLLTLMLLNFGAPGVLGLIAASTGFWRRTRLSNALLGLSGLVLALTWHASRSGLFARPDWAGAGLYPAALASASAGLLVALRERHPGGRDALALCLIGLGAIVCGFIPGYVNEFGLRGGFVVALGLGALIAGLLRQAESWTRAARLGLRTAAILLALAAIPTTIIDLRNGTNLDDPRFITYLSPREAAALEWIRGNTPPGALVQGLPDRIQAGRGRIGNFINALGERRMAVGKSYYAGQFGIGTVRAEQRVRAVERIFRNTSLARRLRPIVELKIDYLTIGVDERGVSRADPGLFSARPEWFTPVFDNEEVRVYRVDREAVARGLAELSPEAPPQAEEPR
jgi:hypothetical protein